MKKRNKPVIPGFGLSMGITISILSLVVLIPLASLVIYTAKLSFRDFIETITRARVLGEKDASSLALVLVSRKSLKVSCAG